VLSDEESERRRADGEQRADEYYTEIEVRRRLWQPIDRSIDRSGGQGATAAPQQRSAGQRTDRPLVPDSPTASLAVQPAERCPSSAIVFGVSSHCWEATSGIGPQVGWESTSASAAHKTEAVHKGIKCNACDMDPIRGESSAVLDAIEQPISDCRTGWPSGCPQCAQRVV
jgi:hypothetical protein